MIRSLPLAQSFGVGLALLALVACGSEPTSEGRSASATTSAVTKKSGPKPTASAVASAPSAAPPSASSAAPTASASPTGPLDPSPANVDALVGGGPALSGLPVRATDGDKPFDVELRSRLSRQAK